MGLARVHLPTFNFTTMGEKVFIVSIDGQIGVTNLSFEEVSEILATAVANKNENENKNEMGVSEEELNGTVDEFCFGMMFNPRISTKVLGNGLETEDVHRKSLAFAKSKGISLTEMFSDLNEMSDDELASQLKAIYGIDLQ